MVVTKHELLKITDKLIFSSDYIQQIHILIIKYTFSSKLFSSTAYINMQTQVVKKSLYYQVQNGNLWKTKIKMLWVLRKEWLMVFHLKVKPNDLFVLNEWNSCTQDILLCTLYLLTLGKSSIINAKCATFLYTFLPPSSTAFGGQDAMILLQGPFQRVLSNSMLHL